MTRDEAMKAVYTKEEIDQMVDERVKMYFDGYGCPQPHETPAEKSMRVAQEAAIDRENIWHERMGY